MVIVKLIMNKPIFAKKTGWQGTKKNGASIKKIFRSEHCERKVFNTFRRQEKFCDIALVSSDGTMRMKVHRMILAAKMHKIDAAFENSSEMQTIMDADTLNRVVHFCYTNQVSVDDYKQVFHLLKAAEHYDIADLREQSQQFVQDSIDMNPSLSPMFLRLSNANGFDELAQKCLNMVCVDFERIANGPEFNEFGTNDIASILKSDQLCVRNEEFVFTALMKWLVKGDHMDLRRLCTMPIPIVDGIPEIMSHIKFPLMDQSFFEKYAHKICVAMKCNDLVIEYYQYQLNKISSPNKAQRMENKRMKPRRSADKLIIFGSCLCERCFSAEMLPAMQDKWTELGEIAGLEKLRRDHMSIAYRGDDQVVVTGGIGKTQMLKRDAILIDLKLRKIKKLPAMSLARRLHASVFHDGALYVAGGIGTKGTLDSVEKFDFERGCWSHVKSMSTKRSHLSMVVAHDRIYAIGGLLDKQIYDFVDCYDPIDDAWHPKHPLKEPRSLAGVVLFNERIYAIGGSIITEGMTSVERYDFEKQDWETVAPLSIARGFTACCVYDNRLIAVGGHNSRSEPVDIVEYYDENENKWHHLSTINKPKGGSVAFVTSSALQINT